MGWFNDSNGEISRGDNVKVDYAGIEGVVVSVDGDEVMISYMTEDDREVVETYNISDVRKI